MRGLLPRFSRGPGPCYLADEGCAVKASKYLNRKTVVDGITFDSAKEARRWSELQLLLRAGKISELSRQERYKLEVNGKLICTYVADFSYLENGLHIIEDVKSEFSRKMPVYRIKKKLLAALSGAEIRET